ncbi:hypothetical protein BB561_003162 [Smittium simulii]|uniref:U4/U6.U5 small nuclear ribonucleoprotein 27kDa protein domain-containing protein n=1 Tax=Smittium simulii TaxID=133385 RepID=A0A2T9YMN6_9FUNG|nr:hypothetical protein BB561_003162 [Smittium simulii]
MIYFFLERRQLSAEKRKEDRESSEAYEEFDMTNLMGFSGFSTTKGKGVFGNHPGSTNIVKERKYRQYMNRRGGFNRPLDKID